MYSTRLFFLLSHFQCVWIRLASSWYYWYWAPFQVCWPFEFPSLWSTCQDSYHYSVGLYIFSLLICRGSRCKPVLAWATPRKQSLKQGLAGRELIWEMIQGTKVERKGGETNRSTPSQVGHCCGKLGLILVGTFWRAMYNVPQNYPPVL